MSASTSTTISNEGGVSPLSSPRCTYNKQDEDPSSGAATVTQHQIAESEKEVFRDAQPRSLEEQQQQADANDPHHDTDGSADKGPSHEDAPDGGLKAWLVVLGAWCSSFVSYGWINSTFMIPLPAPPHDTLNKEEVLLTLNLIPPS